MRKSSPTGAAPFFCTHACGGPLTGSGRQTRAVGAAARRGGPTEIAFPSGCPGSWGSTVSEN